MSLLPAYFDRVRLALMRLEHGGLWCGVFNYLNFHTESPVQNGKY